MATKVRDFSCSQLSPKCSQRTMDVLGEQGGLWEQPLRRSCAGWVCRGAALGYPIPAVPGCHVSFPRLWFSWERLGSPGESEMSQEPRALRVCVNCFLPGALGREPRRLSQRLEQYKQMPSTSSTRRRKMSWPP